MMKERSVQCSPTEMADTWLVVTVALSIPGRGPEESWIRGVHSQEQCPIASSMRYLKQSVMPLL